MKYQLSIDSQSFTPDKLDGIKWTDLHYPSKSTDIERAEIDKLVNEEIRNKSIMNGNEMLNYNDVLDQTNIDRQIEIIKKSGETGLIFYLCARRVEKAKVD